MNLLIERIEDVPLFDTSLRIMKFWSFLLVHNWRRYVCLTPYILINTSQFLDIYYSVENIDLIVKNAYIMVLWFNTILRAVLLCEQRFRYEHFMEELRLLYLELMYADDSQLRHLLKETTRETRALAKINLIMGGLACIGFVSYPLFAAVKALPFGIYIPFVDKLASPYYEFFFALQVTITPMGCCMYIPFTNLIVAFMMFAILMCKVLQHKLHTLGQLQSADKVHAEVIWCVNYQLKLVKFVDTLNGLISYMFLFEFLAFGAMLCVMLFLFLIVETTGQMIIVTAYIIMIFSQSVVLYYFGDELYQQSLLIGTEAYYSNWYNFDVRIQKMIQLIMLRGQKACAIMVGTIYPMNMELLKSLLNTTYSYFTILRRVYG